MPTDYVQQSGTPVQEHFAQLLDLIGGNREKRKALLFVYAEELGDPAQGGYTLKQVEQDILDKPMRFFMLVSALLADPPVALDAADRQRIVQGLRIPLVPDREYLAVTDTGIWLRELAVEPSSSKEPVWLQIARYEYLLSGPSGDRGIVPMFVYQYLKSAASCYREELLPAAVALAAIAFEACLREVLKGFGHDMIECQPPYKPAHARVKAYLTGQLPSLSFDVAGACRDIHEHVLRSAPKGPQNYLGTIKFDIVREDPPTRGANTGTSPRVCLRIRADCPTADLLSSDERETTHGHREAKKFVEFCEAARRSGHFLARRVAPDTVDTLREVRNHLVHWDESSLNTKLRNGQTVDEYANTEQTVRTTIRDVAGFISGEYYDLRKHQMQG
jgi:hypothetical protein